MALSADILTRTQSPHITAGEGQVQVQEVGQMAEELRPCIEGSGCRVSSMGPESADWVGRGRTSWGLWWSLE